jgi:hypothetical protein
MHRPETENSMKTLFLLALLVSVATACGGGKKSSTAPDRSPMEHKGDATGGAAYGGAAYGKSTPNPAAPK